jgi:hypothetical protein
VRRTRRDEIKRASYFVAAPKLTAQAEMLPGQGILVQSGPFSATWQGREAFMDIDGRLLAEIRLDNGLVLFIYDQSRCVAGDRWRAQLLMHLPILIKESHFENCEDAAEAYTSFRLSVREEIHFQQQRVRNFIDQKELPALLEEMKIDCLRFSSMYLGKPSFAAKLVQQRYRQWKQEQSSRVAHAQRVVSAG